MQNGNFIAGIDTDSNTATWMKRAVSENLTWQQEMNRIKGVSNGSVEATQPSMIGTDGIAAREESYKYTWTQDDDEIKITVPFTFKVIKLKLKVLFLPKSIKVKSRKI